jgi:hypothetical protein
MNGYPFFSLWNHGADHNTFLSLPKSKLPEFSLQETGSVTGHGFSLLHKQDFSN